jgi:peptide methionine sulfoxide reductase MsrB
MSDIDQKIRKSDADRRYCINSASLAFKPKKP